MNIVIDNTEHQVVIKDFLIPEGVHAELLTDMVYTAISITVLNKPIYNGVRGFCLIYHNGVNTVLQFDESEVLHEISPEKMSFLTKSLNKISRYKKETFDLVHSMTCPHLKKQLLLVDSLYPLILLASPFTSNAVSSFSIMLERVMSHKPLRFITLDISKSNFDVSFTDYFIAGSIRDNSSLIPIAVYNSKTLELETVSLPNFDTSVLNWVKRKDTEEFTRYSLLATVDNFSLLKDELFATVSKSIENKIGELQNTLTAVKSLNK